MTLCHFLLIAEGLDEYLDKSKVSWYFGNMLVFWHVYHMTEVVQDVVGSQCSIMVIGALTCALLHSMCDLKATQMNDQHNLIWELILYELKLGYNAA